MVAACLPRSLQPNWQIGGVAAETDSMRRPSTRISRQCRTRADGEPRHRTLRAPTQRPGRRIVEAASRIGDLVELI